jgi:ABC-type phosphate/phosphonate transport system substrate-binding protein
VIFLRKYIIFIVVAILAVMAGCSKKETAETDVNHSFKGKSDHWIATYQVEGNGGFFERLKGTDPKSKQQLILTYKGDVSELSTLKKLTYSLVSSESKGNETVTFNEPTTKKEFTFTEIKGKEMEPSDETVSVKVKWDGKEEKISLK